LQLPFPLKGVGEWSTKPLARQTKSDHFEPSQVGIARIDPVTPEQGIASFKQAGQLIAMRQSDIVAKHVAKHVQRRKTGPIYWGECLTGSASQERARVDTDAVVSGVPDGVVKFDRDGHVRIEVVSSPMPSEGPDQRTRVFVGQRFGAIGGVPKRPKGTTGLCDVARLTEEIDVVLNTSFRIDGESAVVRESFQHNKADRQRRRDFRLSLPQALTAGKVARSTRFDFLVHPQRH
jgi:hypothetical protein